MKKTTSSDERSGNESRAYSNIFLLFGEVCSESAQEVCAWILNANYAEEKPPSLNLIINSPGGTLNDGFAIIDIMQSSAIPVCTVGLGEVMSAGLMIFMAGAPGHRTLTPSTSVMSHEFSTGVMGKHNELMTMQKELSLTHERMMNHYKKFTKLSKADIEKYLLPSSDVYLTPKEAVKLGLADRIALL